MHVYIHVDVHVHVHDIVYILQCVYMYKCVHVYSVCTCVVPQQSTMDDVILYSYST